MRKLTSYFYATTVIFGVLFSLPVQAEVQEYTFDKAHTQVMFSVNHLGFSYSHGKFLDFDGGLFFDVEKPELSSVNVTIKTASINMDHKKWEKHLKNEDFFNVDKFPEMTFKSTNVKVTGDNVADITGDLTLLGITKPITLQAVYNKSGVHPYSKMYISGFSATGTLKRSDFGMGYALPGVGDDITLNIQVEAVRKGMKNTSH